MPPTQDGNRNEARLAGIGSRTPSAFEIALRASSWVLSGTSFLRPAESLRHAVRGRYLEAIADSRWALDSQDDKFRRRCRDAGQFPPFHQRRSRSERSSKFDSLFHIDVTEGGPIPHRAFGGEATRVR